VADLKFEVAAAHEEMSRLHELVAAAQKDVRRVH
jgi:hypothetical protein